MTRNRIAGVLTSLLLVIGAFSAAFAITSGRLRSPPAASSLTTARPVAGTEIVAVFIASSTCGASRYPGLREALHQIRIHLAHSAGKNGLTFVSVGVALDRDPLTGIDFLAPFGPFDEILSGGGWMNTGALAFMARDLPGQWSVPQLVLVERDIVIDRVGLATTSPDRLIGRKIGGVEIMSFADLLRANSEVLEPKAR